ncbi:hypothetical protein D3C71_2158340 [compost metagenome]
MMVLHPGFAGGEQLLALFGGEGLQNRIRRVGQQRQLLAEVGGEGGRNVRLQKVLPVHPA